MAKNTRSTGVTAVVEALREGFRAEASALKSLALAFFALPLMDRDAIAAMWQGFLPELIAGAQRDATVPAGTPEDEARIIRETAGRAMSDYASQIRSYVTKVTLSQKETVTAARDAYGRGEYPMSLRAAYNIARGKQKGGGRGEKEEGEEVKEATEALTKADASSKQAAIAAIFGSMSKAEQSATLAVLTEIHSKAK